MCRLALMNRAAAQRLGPNLAALFTDLELSMGGHGNGVAALWSETAEVSVRKGLTLTATQAAARVLMYADCGADWMLFHTRLATSGGRASRYCHPFKSGRLVLAHNGHSFVWDELGSSLGISDSECITKCWSRLRLPLSTLEEVDGVFLGFRSGAPFVVKGYDYDDLTVSVKMAESPYEKTGAILFASELPETLRCLFDQTVEVGHLLWFGGELDIREVQPRQRLVTRYATSSSPMTDPSIGDERQWGTTRADEGEASSYISLSDLRNWYRSMEQEEGNELPHASSPSDFSTATTPINNE
jgi:hypothetical protein